MTTQLTLVPAGSQSPVFPINPLQSVLVGPQVLGGTMTLYTGPTPNGPWTPSVNALGNAASVRALQGQYAYAVAASQAGLIAVSDFGAGAGPQPNLEPVFNCQGVLASPNSTSEVVLASIRIPPGVLKPNFRMNVRGTASFTNNVNAKTLQVRMNGLAGTLVFQSPALASNANYAFEADFCGIGDGATLKGLGAGATGGWGLSTTALTTLAFSYLNTELEIVITCTKATGTDTFQLDSCVAWLQQ